jgi:hypothetical protein
MYKSALKAVGTRLINSCIYELTILFVDNIMVHYSLLSALRQHKTIRSLLYVNIGFHVANGAETNSDKALHYEIHLVHFL